MARFKFNEKGINAMVEAARVKLEEEANAILRETVRQVGDEMEGRPADEVYAELLDRIKARIPTFEPNEPVLRRYAQAIHDRTLTD